MLNMFSWVPGGTFMLHTNVAGFIRSSSKIPPTAFCWRFNFPAGRGRAEVPASQSEKGLELEKDLHGPLFCIGMCGSLWIKWVFEDLGFEFKFIFCQRSNVFQIFFFLCRNEFAERENVVTYSVIFLACSSPVDILVLYFKIRLIKYSIKLNFFAIIFLKEKKIVAF